MGSKILKATFIFLLLIILAEIGYFFLVPGKISSKPNVIALRGTSQGKFIETRKKNPDDEKFASAEPAIDPTTLDFLKSYPKSPSSKLYIWAEVTNIKVLEIESKSACVEDRRNEVVFPGEICFPFSMKLENSTVPEGYNWTFLTENQIKKTQVFVRVGRKETRASLSDIKTGDTISTVEKWDPSVPRDMNHLKDTLDKQMVEFTIYIEKQ